MVPSTALQSDCPWLVLLLLFLLLLLSPLTPSVQVQNAALQTDLVHLSPQVRLW
jgi:hypothetical protein